MKNLRTSVLCVCVTLYSLCTAAQANSHPVPINEPNYNKPKLFQGQPDNIPVNLDNLNSLFSKQVGLSVSVNLAEASTFQFDGQVISTASKYNNSIQSVVLRCSNFNGAQLTVSKVIDENGTTVYRGRIISMQHGDLYELQQSNGKYALVKRNFYDVINE
jgi:hypothetical protein